MDSILLFTDGSVNTKTKIGFGACLCLSESYNSIDDLKKEIQIKKFENTTSVKLEIQTLLWALMKFADTDKKIIIYTDSQNIVGLPNRRKRLEENNYHSKNNREITNADLYRDFFQITDKLHCKIIKVKGHQQSKNKDEIARFFTLVDRASRSALRSYSN